MGQRVRHILFVAVLLVSFGLITKACDDILVGVIEEGQAVQVHFELYNSSGDLNGNLGTDTEELYIDEVQLLISELVLIGNKDSTHSFSLPDSSVILFPEDPDRRISEKVVPEGRYNKLSINLGSRAADSTGQDPSSFSLTVSGRLNGEPFVYNIKDDLSLAVGLKPQLQVGSSTDSLNVVTLFFDYSDWFKSKNNRILHPADSTHHGTILENIRSSVSFGNKSSSRGGREGVSPIIEIGLVGDVSAEESADSLEFAVKLTNAALDTVTINYQTSDRSATAGTDYTAASGTLLFEPGELEKSIGVQLLDDEISENDKKFTIKLTDPVNVDLDPKSRQASGTIIDDDTDSTDGQIVGKIGLKGDVVVEESADSVYFTVELTAPSADTVKVSYGTSNNSARAGSDYAEASGTVVFTPGMAEQLIGVKILDDEVSENNEKFTLKLFDPVNAGFIQGALQATATIIDDDDGNF